MLNAVLDSASRLTFQSRCLISQPPTEGLGFTQDLSSRGAFLFTDMALSEGAEIELTLRMPCEITLGENMRVRCRGQRSAHRQARGQRLESGG